MKPRLSLPGTRACLFDMDGVLTQTAEIHAVAWKETFDAYLVERAQWTGEPFVPFDLADGSGVASKHCKQVLESAGIDRLFDARIDGVVADDEHLAGKPASDTFLAAAETVGVAPAEAVVFEDALAGVDAGRAGHFGFVVGLDRAGQAAELKRHGADVVVRDLGTLLERS